MGNYQNFEYDFIKRTLALIAQYEDVLHGYEFEEQYNYTLLINCLLGLIVMPKERMFSYTPNERITSTLKEKMGFRNSTIAPHIKDMRQLTSALRNSIAHLNILVESCDNNGLIDRIVLNNDDGHVATFMASELLPFIRYYSTWVLNNIEKYCLERGY